MARDDRRALSDQAIGDVARDLDQVGVLLEVGEAQQRRATLARAEVFAGTAQQQVLARDLEAVVGFVYDLEAHARGFRQRLVVEQDRMALLRAAPDAPAQLVELP